MRILIIDDDKTLQQSLRLGFESHAYAVDCCDNGETGSYTARTNDYDLIILDMIMPKKLGHIVCQEIRAAGKNTPIIGLSVRGDSNSKVQFLDNGADDYVTKPFSFNELLARMRALMRRPRTLTEDILEIDNLQVDIPRQKAKRGKKDIYLTRKEFSLLEFMMRHKSKVVSRGMIMEHVWNQDGDPFSNTIEAHILNLRKKIEARGWRKLIHSVPGRGYKIDVVNTSDEKVST